MVSLRRLSDGSSYWELHDQSRMSVESVRSAFHSFLWEMKSSYRPEYLNRYPYEPEVGEIESQYASSSFPSCVGALDCMHLHWKNCPKSWKGQYRNPKSGKLATIQVEAVCDSELYCWHVFGGISATNNDLTVVESSPLLGSILNGDQRMKLNRCQKTVVGE